MGRIYKQAMRVSAYLGEEDTHDEEAVTLIYGVQGMIVMMTTRTEENLKGIAFSEPSQNSLREQTLQLYAHKGPVSREKKVWDLSWTGLPNRGIDAWSAFASIHARPWFMRIWVIQEVVIPSQVEIFLGSLVFSWRWLLDMWAFIGQLGLEHYIPVTSMH